MMRRLVIMRRAKAAIVNQSLLKTDDCFPLDSPERNVYKRKILRAMLIRVANLVRLTESQALIVRTGIVRVIVGIDCSG